MFSARNVLFTAPIFPLFDTVGSAGVGGTSPITFSDTAPADANYSLIWVEFTSSSASPTSSLTYGSTSAASVQQLNIVPANNMFLSCFKIPWSSGPPTGSQTVTFTCSTVANCAMDVVHYKNVAGVGTPITLANQTGQPSISATSTVPGYLYAQAFGYRAAATGNTYTLYNQVQHKLIAASTTAPNSPPLVIGDAPGNGGTLTFSATRSSTTNPWGGMIVPLIAG
jgi:hypothetical protein